MAKTKELNLTKGLRAWAIKNNMSPALFSRHMGYRPEYAWDLLRGKGKFTQEGFGRFARVYSLGHAAELLQLAGDQTIQSIEYTSCGNGKVESYPVVTVTCKVMTPEAAIS